MERWLNKKTDKLLDALLLLNGKNEARRFLRDLLTEQEILEFGNRWQAARMLAKKVPYVKIVKETGLSSTTVARISKWLNKGMGGYKIIINKMNHHGNSTQSRRGLS